MPFANKEAEYKHISCDIFERGEKKFFEFFSMVICPALMKNCASVSYYFLCSPDYTIGSQLEQCSFCYQSVIPHISNKKPMAKFIAVKFATQMSMCI